MKAGSLLRLPQVCWLNSYFKYAGIGPLYPDSYVYHIHAIDADGNILPEYFLAIPGVTTANAEYIEQERLKSVFSEAKSRIESVRAGRTWVLAWDWVDPTGPTQSHSFDGFVQCQAPRVSSLPFLGTDFLNIWCGDALLDVSGTRFTVDAYEPGSAPDEDPWFAGMYRRVVGTHGSFRGHRTALFHPGVSWSGSYERFIDAGGSDGDWFYVDRAVPASRLELISSPSIDSERAIQYGRIGGLFDYFESELGDYGVSHSGDTSDMTADSLVELIADHYGFDPETGRDIV